jgi:hypothetical protein
MPVGASLALSPVVFSSSNATVVPEDVGNWGFFERCALSGGRRRRRHTW